MSNQSVAQTIEKKDIHGIVLLDKPTGMSSNKALQIVKRALKAKKAGHTGALDPLATGLLPLCFGQATKLAEYLLGKDKTYIVTAKLGERTTTSDSEGDIVATKPVPEFNESILENYLQSFRGDILQTPSMYSALKFQGKPYYYYARKGIEIERVNRQVTIFKNELLGFTKDTITLRVQCSKGTYIRTLVDDLGELMGCGAHVTTLHRESIEGIKGQMTPLAIVEEEADFYLQEPSTIITCGYYVLSSIELQSLKIGTLKEISTQTVEDIIVLKDEKGTVFAYAERIENDRFIITKRFIRGFGFTE